jgi:hypothetical protein
MICIKIVIGEDEKGIGTAVHAFRFTFSVDGKGTVNEWIKKTVTIVWLHGVVNSKGKQQCFCVHGAVRNLFRRNASIVKDI